MRILRLRFDRTVAPAPWSAVVLPAAASSHRRALRRFSAALEDPGTQRFIAAVKHQRLFPLTVFASAMLWLLCTIPTRAAESDLFKRGSEQYAAGQFEQSAGLFGQAALADPAPGTLYNLGNAEWQAGRAGPAILAWERAQWLDPLVSGPRNNLHFARKIRQLDAPELAWFEICSAWLPVNWWAEIAAASFWLAAAMLLLPGVFRLRRAGWHQGLAAAAFAVFLLTLPALAGVHTRSKLVVILPRESPLLLTPTTDAQIITKLPAGETGWLERQRGKYSFIRTPAASGWVERAQFGLVAGGG